VGILSTRRGGGTATRSGTSMATPHVTGTADGRSVLLDDAGSF
jgi:subtilisin family serine protease